jgi:hypothetical protein
MPLLPYDTLLIDSPLPVDEARARLEQATGPRRWARYGPPPQPFQGEVTADEVRIERAITYQNSFLPRIRGRLEPRADGSRLQATLSPHPLAAAFMAVWFAGVLLIGVPSTVAGLLAGESGLAVWITPLMLAFGWILCSGIFTIEAHIARGRLAGLLEGAVHPER